MQLPIFAWLQTRLLVCGHKETFSTVCCSVMDVGMHLCDVTCPVDACVRTLPHNILGAAYIHCIQ